MNWFKNIFGKKSVEEPKEAKTKQTEETKVPSTVESVQSPKLETEIRTVKASSSATHDWKKVNENGISGYEELRDALNKDDVATLERMAELGFNLSTLSLITDAQQAWVARGNQLLYPGVKEPPKSLLSTAVERDSHKCVSYLISKGLSPNTVDGNGNTALHLAENYDVLSDLLKSGADINVSNARGQTPLYAHTTNGVEFTSLLLNAGANVNRCSKDGWTPLHKAAANCLPDVLTLLLAHGADKDAKDIKGNTPYEVAKLHGGQYREGYEATLALLTSTNEKPSDPATSKVQADGPVCTRDQLICELRKAMDERDSLKHKQICVEIAAWGLPCIQHIREIVLDSTQDFYLRRLAMWVGSGCGDESYREFLNKHFVAGKSFGELNRLASKIGDDTELGFFVAAKDIVDTPNFFVSKYVTKK